MKELNVKDPDRGGSPPSGASGDVLPASAGTASRRSGLVGAAAGAAQEARSAPDNRPRGKKRRKRRRGRKVFARDGSGAMPLPRRLTRRPQAASGAAPCRP